ncbi:TPA: DNA-binding protein [Aeromonas veronii]
MKKPEQWSRFDVADGLATEVDMVAYLLAALEDGDPALLTAALDDVERASSQAAWPAALYSGRTVGSV